MESPNSIRSFDLTPKSPLRDRSISPHNKSPVNSESSNSPPGLFARRYSRIHSSSPVNFGTQVPDFQALEGFAFSKAPHRRISVSAEHIPSNLEDRNQGQFLRIVRDQTKDKIRRKTMVLDAKTLKFCKLANEYRDTKLQKVLLARDSFQRQLVKKWKERTADHPFTVDQGVMMGLKSPDSPSSNKKHITQVKDFENTNESILGTITEEEDCPTGGPQSPSYHSKSNHQQIIQQKLFSLRSIEKQTTRLAALFHPDRIKRISDGDSKVAVKLRGMVLQERKLRTQHDILQIRITSQIEKAREKLQL